MSTRMNHEELVELLQEGRIGYLRLVLDSEEAEDFLAWCRSHGTEPTDEAAEFYIEQTDMLNMDRQLIDNEDYGIWN